MRHFEGAGWDDQTNGWPAFGFILKSVCVCSFVLIVMNKVYL
jgi:hypothetical protein